MSALSKKLPLLIALVGGFFVVKKFVAEEIENYENGLGVTVKGFKPSWNFTDPLNVNFDIYIDIRNDNRIGGEVLGFDGWITWGEDGTKLAKLGVEPFSLNANGAINKSTWEVKVNLLQLPTGIQEQIQAGEWQQLLWLDGKLKTSYGNVTIKDAMINL